MVPAEDSIGEKPPLSLQKAAHTQHKALATLISDWTARVVVETPVHHMSTSRKRSTTNGVSYLVFFGCTANAVTSRMKNDLEIKYVFSGLAGHHHPLFCATTTCYFLPS